MTQFCSAPYEGYLAKTLRMNLRTDLKFLVGVLMGSEHIFLIRIDGINNGPVVWCRNTKQYFAPLGS